MQQGENIPNFFKEKGNTCLGTNYELHRTISPNY